MTISLTDSRALLNDLIHDEISSTLTADGDTDKTTLADSLLAKYPDGWFKDFYISGPFGTADVTEIRKVKSFLSPSGKSTVWSAFATQPVTDDVCTFHRFHPDKKKDALNEALLDAFPDLYAVTRDTSLAGAGNVVYTLPRTETPDRIYYYGSEAARVYYRVYDAAFDVSGDNSIMYANIPTGKTILLIYYLPLTEFTIETSTTELNKYMMKIVAFKAAASLYHKYSATIDAQDAGRFESKAKGWEDDYDKRVKNIALEAIHDELKVDESWMA